jgi:hypothetical protein
MVTDAGSDSGRGTKWWTKNPGKNFKIKPKIQIFSTKY